MEAMPTQTGTLTLHSCLKDSMIFFKKKKDISQQMICYQLGDLRKPGKELGRTITPLVTVVCGTRGCWVLRSHVNLSTAPEQLLQAKPLLPPAFQELSILIIMWSLSRNRCYQTH